VVYASGIPFTCSTCPLGHVMNFNNALTYTCSLTLNLFKRPFGLSLMYGVSQCLTCLQLSNEEQEDISR
jgi:hypothetical protein